MTREIAHKRASTSRKPRQIYLVKIYQLRLASASTTLTSIAQTKQEDGNEKDCTRSNDYNTIIQCIGVKRLLMDIIITTTNPNYSNQHSNSSKTQDLQTRMQQNDGRQNNNDATTQTTTQHDTTQHNNKK